MAAKHREKVKKISTTDLALIQHVRSSTLRHRKLSFHCDKIGGIACYLPFFADGAFLLASVSARASSHVRKIAQSAKMYVKNWGRQAAKAKGPLTCLCAC